MRPKIFFFALSFLISSLYSSGQKINPDNSGLSASFTKYTLETNSFGGDLKYVRIFKDGKWWIYVYNGAELVDIYPE